MKLITVENCIILFFVVAIILELLLVYFTQRTYIK